jgi:Mg-chelatase subunit ChlD
MMPTQLAVNQSPDGMAVAGSPPVSANTGQWRHGLQRLCEPEYCAFVSSLLIHCIALLTLSLLISGVAPGSTKPLALTLSTIASEEPEVLFDVVAEMPSLDPATSGSAGLPASPAAANSDVVAAVLAVALTDDASPGPAEVELGTIEPDAGISVVHLMAEISSKGASKRRSPNGEGFEGDELTTFFGVKAKGKSLVYVVDCSSSMDGMPMDRLKRELASSIRELPRQCRFAVIFFNSTAIPMSGSPSMNAADSKAKEEAIRWVNSIPADGGTDPCDALRMAMSLTPSAIYLMTDGEFTYPFAPDVMKMIESCGENDMRVNTVAFGDQAAAGTLRAIAGATGGTHAIVALQP